MLAGVASGHRAALHQCAQLAQAFQRGIGAEAFVALEQFGLALFLRHAHGHHFGVETACLPRCRSTLVAAQRKLVGRFTADAVIAGQVFGGFDHAGDGAKALHRLRALAATVQAVVHGDVASAFAPAQIGGVVLDVGHALDTAGNHHIGGTALHHHAGGHHGLQAAAATAVELHAGHLYRQTGLQSSPAAHARGFAAGVRLGKHHVVDAARVDTAALDHGAYRGGGQLFHRHRAQAAAVGANRGSQGGDNGGFAHGFLQGVALVSARGGERWQPAHRGVRGRQWPAWPARAGAGSGRANRQCRFR